jgi:hypothetical protein
MTGKGDGTFSVTPRYLVTVDYPLSLSVGDFNGDGRTDFALVTSQSFSVILGTGRIPTNVSLGSSSNPAVAGQSVTLTAAVSATSGGPVASGNMTFYDGLSLLGNSAVVNGQASLTTSLLPPGTHSLKASYLDSGAYFNSSSAAFSQTVIPVPSAGFTPLGYVDGDGNGVTVADFNRDGKADLAIANYTGGYVSILLGNGDGTFQKPVHYFAVPSPTWVAAGDFNGDGNLDLAVTHAGNSFVSIFLGRGDGTFPSLQNLKLTGASYCATVADFNGDGKADLAATNLNGGVSILLGNGDGTFGSAAFFPAGSNSVYLASGDFNGDGKTDLAVANQDSNNVSILLGNGDGTFQNPRNFSAGVQPSAVATGDFNGDGKPDLVVSNYGGGVSVLLGNGDGNFQGAVSYLAGNQPNGVTVGDLNGDGKADIAVANYGGTLSVLSGNGNGTFQPAMNYPAGTRLTTLAIGDFNGDGRSDVVVVGLDGNITILLGKVPLAGAQLPATRVGVFRNGAAFLEDSNGNAAYDPGTDRYIPSFTGPGGFTAGDMPVVGDWTGDGNTKIGIYRSSTGTWFLDANNNGIFDAGDYQYQFGGIPGDIAFAGDWLGTGKSCIGIYRSQGSVWLLDLNCNGNFENVPADAFFPFGGVPGDVPVVGSWTGEATRVGVVRKYAPAGLPQGNPFYWVLDGGAANAGSAATSHQPDVVRCFAFGGVAGDVFLTGDWYGTGISAGAVYRNGLWVIDAALPGAPLPNHVPGITFGYGGVPTDVPVTGKW